MLQAVDSSLPATQLQNSSFEKNEKLIVLIASCATFILFIIGCLMRVYSPRLFEASWIMMGLSAHAAFSLLLFKVMQCWMMRKYGEEKNKNELPSSLNTSSANLEASHTDQSAHILTQSSSSSSSSKQNINSLIQSQYLNGLSSTLPTTIQSSAASSSSSIDIDALLTRELSETTSSSSSADYNSVIKTEVEKHAKTVKDNFAQIKAKMLEQLNTRDKNLNLWKVNLEENIKSLSNRVLQLEKTVELQKIQIEGLKVKTLKDSSDNLKNSSTLPSSAVLTVMQQSYFSASSSSNS